LKIISCLEKDNINMEINFVSNLYYVFLIVIHIKNSITLKVLSWSSLLSSTAPKVEYWCIFTTSKYDIGHKNKITIHTHIIIKPIWMYYSDSTQYLSKTYKKILIYGLLVYLICLLDKHISLRHRFSNNRYIIYV